jgi:hypothetical protein
MSVLMVLTLMSVQEAHAAAVRVSWSNNSESDLAGYKIYYGQASRNYQWYIDAGNATSTQITNLNSGTTYYLAVTAYDRTGNESAYSQEVQAVIPAQSGGGSVPSGGDTGGSVPVTDDVIRDVIGDVDEPIDLSSLNPSGTYSIVPILSSSPEVVDNILDIVQPGVYLYNVYDATGALAYQLRVSVASHLVSARSFEPGLPFNLDALTFGVAIQLGVDALTREVPIGIGSQTLESASAMSMGGWVEFDLLPFGLALAEPAIISVRFDKKNPVIQRYDEKDSSWKNISGVTVSSGLVSFSTQELGKFRISSEDSNSTDVSSASSGGGGGGGCFISSASL